MIGSNVCVGGIPFALFPGPLLNSKVLFQEDNDSPFFQPRIKAWTVKGAVVNLEPGQSGSGLDHFHLSTTDKLTLFSQFCFLRLDV